MKITYTLEESDYLTYQLFVASKSERIAKKRRKSQVLVPFLYVLLGLFMGYQGNMALGITFGVLAVLWFFLYPVWEKNVYIKHYKNFIREHHRGNYGRAVSLEITDTFLLAKDGGNEGKVLTEEIDEINEIESLIFIRLKGGQSFILPKLKITEIQSVREYLQGLAKQLQISYSTALDWRWK
jgi:hypothetical protein